MPPNLYTFIPISKWVIHLIEFVLKEAILQIRERAASMDSVPTSNTPIPNCTDMVAGRTHGVGGIGGVLEI